MEKRCCKNVFSILHILPLLFSYRCKYLFGLVLCEHGLLTEHQPQRLGLFLNRLPSALDTIAHISIVIRINRDPANVVDTTESANIVYLLNLEVVPLEVVESCAGQPPLGLWVLCYKAFLCLLLLFGWIGWFWWKGKTEEKWNGGRIMNKGDD